MGGFDVTRIAESELEMLLEEMRDCETEDALQEKLEDAQDCLLAFYNSLLARL